MKTLKQLSFTCLVHLWLFSSVMAQTPVWLSHYGNDGNPYNDGMYLVTDNQGNIYGSGTVGSPGLDVDGHELTVLGQRDVLFVKWDASGHAVWAYTAGGTVNKAAPDGTDKDGGGFVAYDPQSTRLVQCGNYGTPNSYFGPYVLHGPSNGDAGNFIASYGADGECLWVKEYLGAVHSRILIDAASNIFMLGFARYSGIIFPSVPPVSFLPGGYVAKYAMDGTFLAAERVVALGTLSACAWAEPEHWVFGGQLDPGAMIYGQAVGNIGNTGTGYVAHTDTSGNVQWVTTFASDSTSDIWNVAADPTGEVAVSGYFYNDLLLPNDTLFGILGQRTYFLAYLDTDGTPLWTHALRSPGQETYIADLSVDPDGDIYACGLFTDSISVQDVGLSASTSRDGFVLRLHPEGSVAALQNFGRITSMRSIIAADDGIFIAGKYDSTLAIGSTSVLNSLAPYSQYGAADFFIAKFDSLSGVTSIPSMAPLNTGLRIYANPNNGLCTIDFPEQLRITSGLTLSVYDNTGQLIQRVPFITGGTGLKLDIRAQAKGIYHVELGDGIQRYSGTIVFE